MIFTSSSAAGSSPRRRRRGSRWAALVAALASMMGLVAMGAGASVAQAQTSVSAAPHAVSARHAAPKLKPVVRYAVRHDKSKPLITLKPLKTLSVKLKHNVVPLGVVPHSRLAGTGAADKSLSRQVVTRDVQRAATVTTNTMPAFEQNFEGVGNLNGVLPPDTNMAVGPNDVIQTVNFSFQIFDKQGNTLLGPETLSTLWQGFGGECDPAVDPSAANGGDVVALYDESADRFIVTQLAYPQLVVGSGGFHECIAISQTGDPTGAWFRYDFLFSNTSLNDYPKFGVWPDGYYMANNNFLNGQVFTGVTVTAFDRAEMLAGQQASDVQFVLGSQYNSLLPGDTEGGALGFTPPNGAPDPYWMSCDAANGGSCTSDQMDEWDFHVDWTNPANSTFGNNGAPSTTIPVATFNSNLCNFNRDCITQPGTSQGVDALSDRLMYQAAYRNLGNGTQAVVFDQTVNVSTTGGNQAGVRWYEFTNTGTGWGVGDQGTYAPDTDNRWMGSANIDVNGDIAVGYSVSSSVTFPSIRVAGRLAGDPAGQLAQGEESMIAGGGDQTDSQARWGDYSAMQVDPTDGCTFWYTQEYIPTTSDDSWHTRVGSFKFPSCVVGPHGTISGTVTDSGTGNPITGATVTAGSASTTTTSTGAYSLTLPVGSYTETVAAYGYGTDTISNVGVTSGGDTTENAALTTEPSVQVSGAVTDGSGQGWGLHASISVTGRPGGPVWTDPATGAYSVALPENATYALTVTADLPGYQVVSTSVTVGTSPVTDNISVPVDVATCTAPGYQFTYGTPVLSENFDDYTGDGGTTPPPGWTIQDNVGNGEVWQFNNPENRGNLTGGSGFFAAANSDQFGAGVSQDTSLITPVLNLSGDTNPILQFNNDYNGFPGQTGAVDVSTDGGTTWTNVWQHTTDSVRGPIQETVALPQAASQSNVEVRFHFTSTFGWWWEVDNVNVVNQSCSPIPGGLVVGQTTDANTGTGLNGVTVTETNASPAVSATSATDGDPAVATGYYWLFSPLTGQQPFTATKGGYGTGSSNVTVTASAATRANFTLGAGRLSISPATLSTTQVLGSTKSTTLKITNTGTAQANVKLDQRGGSFQILTAKGSPLKMVALGDDEDTQANPAFLGGHANDGSPLAYAGPPNQPSWSTIAGYPTAVMDNSADFINGKEYSVGGLNSSFALLNNGYVYDPTTNTWSAIASMPVAREKPGVVADNGKLYVTGGWNSSGTPIGETDVYDPTSNSWTTITPNPAPTTAPGVADLNGVIYFVAGCADANCTASSNVETYNTSTGTWASAAPYPHGDSWMSCGGVNGKVYCSGGINGNSTYSDAYVYDPSAGSWSPIANMPIDLWGSVSGAPNGLFIVSGGVTNNSATVTNQGYAYDPTTNAWSSIPNAQFSLYRAGGSCGFYQIGGSSGGFNPQSSSEVLSGLSQCGTTTIPWMAESPTTFALDPGQSVTIKVTLTATPADTVNQPGTYTAAIGFEQDTPYQVNPENVTMNVTPPKTWGKITGTLFGENCSQVSSPLRGVVYADATFSKLQFTNPTATNGTYAFWGPQGVWRLTASAAGWIAVNSKKTINAGKTLTVNITLRPVTC
jgi:N-acetylneuraminic acid mutarotase